MIILQPTKRKILGFILPILILAGIVIIGPLRILFSSSVWNTQTIIYENTHLSAKKVEFQMQDVGALGYNRRTVEVFYLTNFFMIANKVEPNIDQRSEWIKVDKEVNEIELK